MSWLNFFETKTQKKHPFGRGINANISPNEEDLFNKSYEAFEHKDILNAYDYFFKSLENFTNKKSNHNITTLREDENKLLFTMFQGTAKITGYVTTDFFYAEAIIIKKEHTHVALKRYLLERNYQLTYAYYFTDETYIKLKLYHDNITMNPHKIFYPLREIALNADFDKEYLKYEFSNIELEDIEHLRVLPEEELKVKYNFLHTWIDQLLQKIETFPPNDNAGMQAFSYLTFLFKIDYLLVPKYEIYQKMSKKIQEYFSNETSTTEAKNEELKEYILELRTMEFALFKEKFYEAKYTFNPTEKTAIEEINNFINESIIKIRWYKNNRYNQIIPTMYKYIAFYLLYNYGLHPVIKELLHTLVEIQNASFFKALHYQVLYDEESNNFSKKAIIAKIEETITPYQDRFKSLEPFGSKLNFSSLNEFSNSFYIQLKHLNFEEI